MFIGTSGRIVFRAFAAVIGAACGELSAIGLDADPVVHGVLKTLLTAEIFLSGLDGDVAE